MLNFKEKGMLFNLLLNQHVLPHFLFGMGHITKNSARLTGPCLLNCLGMIALHRFVSTVDLCAAFKLHVVSLDRFDLLVESPKPFFG